MNDAAGSGASPPASLPLKVRLSVIARSLLVQAAWNYRTMLGTGMAFALTPVLRHLYDDTGALDRAVARHASHFNAHPYLTPIALGVFARLEAEGESPETIERFRVALRGPLGALGDRLVWAGWLPLCSLAAIVVSGFTSPAVGVLFFLVLYNAGHLALRVGGFSLGWARGATVGGSLHALDLPKQARRIETGVALLVGVTMGTMIPGLEGTESFTMLGSAAGAGAVLGGYALGPRAWRSTAWAVTLIVGALALTGGLFFH
ncbi:MAG: PTS system mannose/fructose/sorbose family transporter subunit IID [Longimicrobiales bacterium]|nr:PTS system mannose/fructose/sorbose family transporter subunit IID [Longimicrobiales bacterium]